MTGLRGQVRDYLALRRAMGFKMEKYGTLLDSLAGYLEAAGLATVTVQAAAEWAMLPQGVHPHRWKQRLDAARGFARYLAASDPAAEVPPAGLLDARPNRHQPYIFTGQEIAALLAAAGQHRWHLPAVTYPALFGLIASTGLRISEALALDDADADPDEAMITIRDSKYGKSRRIPVDATVAAALRDYLERRRALRPAPAAPALFISACGTRLIGHLANAEFRRITAVTGTGVNAVNPPRIHDMRHTFAVRTPAGWRTRRPRHDSPRPDAGSVLHPAHGRAAAGQPPHHRLLPRHLAAVPRLRPGENRHRSRLPRHRRHRRRAGQRLPRPPGSRPRQHRPDPERPAGCDPVVLQVRRPAPPRARRDDRPGPRDPREEARPDFRLLPHRRRDRGPARSPGHRDVARPPRPRPPRPRRPDRVEI